MNVYWWIALAAAVILAAWGWLAAWRLSGELETAVQKTAEWKAKHDIAAGKIVTLEREIIGLTPKFDPRPRKPEPRIEHLRPGVRLPIQDLGDLARRSDDDDRS